MVFIETSVFTKLVGKYLSDDEYLSLQKFLLKYPGTGAVIRGSGGVRKLRWRLPGQGKSGGARIIYFWQASADEIWLLTIYRKSERDSIPSHILKRIAEEIKSD